jgi:hypothetical protein
MYAHNRLIASAGLTSNAEERLRRGLKKIFEFSLAHVSTDQIYYLDAWRMSGECTSRSEIVLVGISIGANSDVLHVLTYDQAS